MIHIYYSIHLFQRPDREKTIYTNGCYGEIEALINDLLPVLGGIVMGIIVFEVRH